MDTLAPAPSHPVPWSRALWTLRSLLPGKTGCARSQCSYRVDVRHIPSAVSVSVVCLAKQFSSAAYDASDPHTGNAGCRACLAGLEGRLRCCPPTRAQPSTRPAPSGVIPAVWREKPCSFCHKGVSSFFSSPPCLGGIKRAPSFSRMSSRRASPRSGIHRSTRQTRACVLPPHLVVEPHPPRLDLDRGLTSLPPYLTPSSVAWVRGARFPGPDSDLSRPSSAARITRDELGQSWVEQRSGSTSAFRYYSTLGIFSSAVPLRLGPLAPYLERPGGLRRADRIRVRYSRISNSCRSLTRRRGSDDRVPCRLGRAGM